MALIADLYSFSLRLAMSKTGSGWLSSHNPSLLSFLVSFSISLTLFDKLIIKLRKDKLFYKETQQVMK